MAAPKLIDDNDPRVQYSPGWNIDYDAHAVGGTRHKAVHAGQTASLLFQGTGIQVVSAAESVVPAGHPQMTFNVDNGAFVQTVSQQLPSDGGRGTTYNVTVFSKRDLSLGAHQLVITNNNGTSPSIFWLDCFLVDLGPSSSTPTSVPSSGSSSPDTISTNTVTPTTPTDTHAASHSHPADPSVSTPTLVIILGVVGSISLTILILGTILCVRRRRVAARLGP
ncbi:hypothetical protein C8Q80DRAFT_1114816 [Daedaleopsis nitida]|nr:hypothetical protein C8Q80DRAFT_1114816 [Daedaleopsis nitida]